MKKIFAFLVFLSYFGARGQLTFINAPRPYQLYPRSLVTNKATVTVSGTMTATGYTEIKVDLYRNNIILATSLQALSGVTGQNFSLSHLITSELAEYKFITSLKDGSGNYTVVYSADNIVAGDAIIIQGQSNAVATMLSGSSGGYQNEFIRVYGYGDPSFSPQVHQWYLGQGDGDPATAGNTGQWGIILADSIVTKTNHPVAVFNGGLGGQLISYFLPNSANPDDLTTNYGRLLTRVKEAGFQNDIRAIFWYQGESNAASNTATDASNYKNDFYTIRNTWIQNYPSITNFYIAQIRFGCLQHDDKTIIIKESQREIAVENANTRIYATAALTHYMDNCHFPFQSGYEKLGQDFCGVVLQDLYNLPGRPDTESPFVKNIIKAGASQIDLMLKNASDHIIIETGALNNFYFEGATVQPVISSALIAGNKISLILSTPLPPETTGLTYAEKHQDALIPDIKNGNGMAIVNFFNMLIVGTPLPLTLLSFGASWQNNHTILLNWSTENESGINGYEIQHCSDGKNFEKIGYTEASNVSFVHNYYFKHAEPGSAINYYRIKIIEENGKINYSPVILLRDNSNYKFIVSVNPNPAKNIPVLSIESPETSNAEIQITNLTGQKIIGFTRNIQAGVNRISLPASLSGRNGTYFVLVRILNSYKTCKFIICE